MNLVSADTIVVEFKEYREPGVTDTLQAAQGIIRHLCAELDACAEQSVERQAVEARLARCSKIIAEGDVMMATFAFWGVFVDAFPEISTGDSQLSGEDQAAFCLWRDGHPGDNPVQEEPHLEVPEGYEERIAVMVQAGAVAAALYLFSETAPALPAAVVSQLTGCVRHLLHFNLPASAKDAAEA